MPAFRIRYALALGPYGSALANTGLTVVNPPILPAQTAQPDVTLGSFFTTINTSAQAITYFTSRQTGQGTTEDGQLLVVLFRDGQTSITNAGQMFMAESGGAFLSNETVTLIQWNSAWYELARSKNSQTQTSVQSVGGTIAPNVDGISVLFLNATAAVTLQALSGGRLGQIVYILPNSGGSTYTATTAGNITIAGTSTFVMNTSGVYMCLNRGGPGGLWTMLRSPQTAAA